MARWAAHLFGNAELISPDGSSFQMSTSVSAIIGYLSTRPAFRANRSVLATQIWPDQNNGQANHCLATCLWRLKRHSKTIPVNVSGEMIELVPNIWVDTKAFELRVAGLYETGRTSTRRLKRAVSFYQGAYLDGHYEDWILIERERLFYLYLDANLKLAEGEMAKGNWASAIKHARLVCQKEPLREDAHRILMQAYANGGNQGLALKQFHICTEILQSELDVSPMEETAQLAADIKKNAGLVNAISCPRPLPSHRLAMQSALAEIRTSLISASDSVDRAIDLIES